MYGLDESTDLGFFVGKTLVQVCFGKHDVVLNFDGQLSVMATSEVKVLRAETFSGVNKELPLSLVALLNHTVLSAQATQSGALRVAFANGCVVEVLDDSAKFESFVIRNGSHTIVV